MNNYTTLGLKIKAKFMPVLSICNNALAHAQSKFVFYHNAIEDSFAKAPTHLVFTRARLKFHTTEANPKLFFEFRCHFVDSVPFPFPIDVA